MEMVTTKESVKTTPMENDGTKELDENKDHNLRCKDRAEKNHMMY